jgi:hypothetical protein
MLLTLQVPLADLRPFVSTPTGRLTKPHWLNPVIGEEFVRGVGPVCARRRGGIRPWPGEDNYVDASSLVRFRVPLATLAGESGHRALRSFQPVFRRLFSNGEAVTRYELGLANLKREKIGRNATICLRRELLGLNVMVPEGPAITSVHELLRVGPALARAVMVATTAQEATPDAWWLTASRPVLLVECADWERPEVGVFHGKSIPTSALALRDIDVYFGAASWAYDFDAWIVSHAPGANRDDRRKLRLHLVRLHAERETLKVVLRALADGRLANDREDPAFGRLEGYLLHATGFLSRGTVYGHDQPALLREAYSYGELVHPGQHESLLEHLHQAKPGTIRKVGAAARGVFPVF